MKGLAIVDKGLEEVALEEITEKIKSKGKKEETRVIFSISKEEDLCRLAYTCQSVRRILLLIKEIKVNNELDKTVGLFKKEINKTDLKKYLHKKVSVKCKRIGEHNFTSVDLASEISKILKDYEFKISRKNNDLVFYIYIYKNKGYFCLDFSDRDLSKRNYRIFTKAGSLKGSLGYAVFRFSKYKHGETLLDPVCESGIIPIEAALNTMNKSVNFYKKEFVFQKIDEKYKKIFELEDKKIKKSVKGIYAFDKLLGNINSSKKNAKIAGVEKNINFSKADIEWLDTKFEKNSVDKIVTKLPSESKNISKNLVEKIYQEFFYQAEFILKKEGVIVICSLKNDLLKESARKKDFKVVDEKKIFSGQQQYSVTIFKKFYKE